MMKYLLTTLSLLLNISLIYAQETIQATITHDDLQREYTLYVPASYNGEEAVPLVFNFHGFGSNATEQMWYGDFRNIADTANFLLVHPQGTLLQGVAHWNVGGFTIGSTVDDVGFTAALIDSLSATFNINPERIYSTGMSNGGFFSYLLACQLSDRIAAIASVTGSMTPETYAGCDPQHPVPVLEIHGTNDSTVPYAGSAYSKSIDEVIDYWVSFNQCASPALYTEIPDINPDDASTVDYYEYTNGDAGVSVNLFKINGGGHTWPGSFIDIGVTNRDINASQEIWKFFSQYDINGLIQVSAVKEEKLVKNPPIRLYPNPATDYIQIESADLGINDFVIRSPLGDVVKRGVFQGDSHSLDLSSLPPNLYFLSTGKQVLRFMKK